jgi:hypothetical protein
MRYDYSGYLKTILHAPDSRIRDSLDHIEIGANEFEQWQLIDDPRDREWQHIPAGKQRTGEGTLLEGHFEDVRRIDNISEDDPSIWVAMSSRKWEHGCFPIDLNRYPIMEITYRCRTPKARPAWQWSYPGGQHFDGLQPTREWRRIARRVQYFGFPQRLDSLTIRLYSTARSTQSMEVQSIRFRAMSPGEAEACQKHEAMLNRLGPAKHYPLLDAFFPMGVYAHVGTAKRLAEIMDISFRDYWRLAMEDIARHHHNCIVLQEMEQLTTSEWRQYLSMAECYGLRVVAMFDWPTRDFEVRGPSLVETFIRPFADSPAMLGWMIANEPPDHSFEAHIEARQLIEQADPNHPLTVMMRDPNAIPLFAPFMAASGMSHFKSHAAWDIGPMLRAHRPLIKGQQTWVTTPGFVYATDTPEWSTCPEIRLMLNQSFSNGAKGWFVYGYHNDPIWIGGSCQRSLTGPFLTFSDVWSELGTRMERFTALAQLLIGTQPGGAPDFPVEIACREHPGAQRPQDVAPIEWYWLHGADYTLLYVLSNDVSEVTSVYLRVPSHFPKGLSIFDMTDFVRSRDWVPMERDRHLEMFPGQGQIMLIAEPHVCERLRDEAARRLLEDDLRQLEMDLSLARRYSAKLPHIQDLLRSQDALPPMDALATMKNARAELLNLHYATPVLAEARSQLIRGSALVCACDGTLCRLLGMGKVDAAHELGLRLLPLTRDLSNQRLALRHGRAATIMDDCVRVADEALRLLHEIRTLT